MTEGTPILELGIILLVAALAGALSRRFGLPAVLGYLALGVVVSPLTPGYVLDRHQLQILADVGVVLLLFEVGIDLDFRALGRQPRGLLAAAPLQVLLTTVIALAVLLAVGAATERGATTIAFAIALSSSVVVINITRSRRRTLDEPTARALVVWAILQDIVSLVAVAILAASLLPGNGDAVPLALLRLAGFGFIAFMLHKFLVPRVLRAVRAEHDSFLGVALGVALATAGIGAVVFGVPLALAAFVAGASLGLDADAHEARTVVLPFRDLFAVAFFVAVGTLLDPMALPANAGLVALVLGLVAVKTLISAGLARTLRVRVAHLQLGIGLGQIGEFSYVVLGIGLAAHVISAQEFSAVLAASVISIALSTVFVRLVHPTRRQAA